MIVKKLILENFRGYKYIEIPFQSGINVIIGKNDVGKSTILESLDIFFGSSKVSIDFTDRCIDSDGNIAITVLFEIDPTKEYLIDTDNKTNLKDEYLLNKDGLLEIRKEWDCSKGKLTAASLTVNIKAEYPSVFKKNPLPTLKIEDLKKILEDKKSVVDIMTLHTFVMDNKLETIDFEPYSSDLDEKPIVKLDKRKRSSIRKTIYEVLKIENNLDLETIQIPLNKEDCKNIYEAIESDFPQYELFQSDRENKDNDKGIQDPLKIVTRRVIKDSQALIDELVKKLEAEIEETSKNTLLKLKEMNKELAEELTAEPNTKDFSSLFSYSFISDRGIPLNKRGSGIRRLVLLNFLRAEAESNRNPNSDIIYALEEPETSQHADHQVMVMDAFKTISEKPNYQVFITTHSTNLIKMIRPEEVIFIKKVEGFPKLIESDNLIYEIAEDLGTLPNLNSNLVVIVEGVTDKYFIETINQVIPEYKEIIDLRIAKIPIFWVGGSNVTNWVNTRPLKDLNMIEFHIYDSDGENHYSSEVQKINNWKNGSNAVETKLPAIENYIHPDIVLKGKEEETIKEYFQANLNNIKANLADKWNEATWQEMKDNWTGHNKVANTLKTLGYSDPKNYLTNHLSKKMTKDLLVDLNVFDEIKGWFEKIKELNEKYN
jgi:putative ATP-dependent endonuclease of OLD family